MQAVIMAGGEGTRLKAVTGGNIPKALAPVAGKPILERQIEKLKEYGIQDITLVTGVLGDKIREYIGDGERFGVRASYYVEEKPLGTAGALGQIGEQLTDEEFMLVFGDIMFDIDIDRMLRFHRDNAAEVTLLAHPNMHPYDSDLIITDKNDKVTGFDSKHNVRDYYYDNLVNAGLYICRRDFCRRIPEPAKTDLEKDILSTMTGEKDRLYAYRTPEYVMDIGTPERIAKAEADIARGITSAKNLKNRQRAIFLDRDGTINKDKGFLRRYEQFELIESAAEAIRKINAAGYLAIVISNQPVIARGESTFEEVDAVMKKMKTLLGQEGVYLDDVYYCPHHPDKGFPGEVPELKIECACRKPKTGMVDAAAERYNIDLTQSWMVGDTTSDAEMARRAGISSVLLTETGRKSLDGRFDIVPTMYAGDIGEAVDKILETTK